MSFFCWQQHSAEQQLIFLFLFESQPWSKWIFYLFFFAILSQIIPYNKRIFLILGSTSVVTVATRFTRPVAVLLWSKMARSTNFWMAVPWRLIFSRGIPEKWPGPCFTGVSIRRVLRKRPLRSVPRGPKNSRGPLLEPHSKISWLKGIRNPKCAKLNVNKPFGRTNSKF